MKARLLICFALIFCGVGLVSCSPAYVLRAAYEQSKILMRRAPIEEVLKEEDLSENDRQKLQLVLQARAFTKEMTLTPGDSFTRYSKIDGDVLLWVLVGSKRDAFSPYTWWFPIVGAVPYKGFFEKQDALNAAQALKKKGYEVWVRGSDAFSTLGWFNDPVLSTTLRQPPLHIVNTVIHESTHRTVWIKDDVAFNESLANFVGTRGAISFAEHVVRLCEDELCRKTAQERVEAAKEDYLQEMTLASALTEIYEKLNALYQSAASSEEKIEKRAAVFDAAMAPLRQRFPKMTILTQINNAEIMQYKLYMTALDRFAVLFAQSGDDWKTFLDRIRTLQQKAERDHLPPFSLLPPGVKLTQQ